MKQNHKSSTTRTKQVVNEKMSSKRLSKELKYLLDIDGKGGRSSYLEKKIEVIIGNGLRKSDSSSEMRTSESSISNLTNHTLISSDSSQELLDNENSDDYNIIINLKDLKRELKKNLSCIKCHENRMKQKMSHFVSYLEKYETKLKKDAAKMLEEGKFNNADGILDKYKYLEYFVSSRHSPAYLYSMYECVDDPFMKFCNPVEISSKSTGIASQIIGTCGVKEHTWCVLPEVIQAKQNKSKTSCVENYELNYALVEAMQGMGCGGTGAEAIIGHLCLGQCHSFAQHFHKLEKNLGDAQESVKKKFLEKALIDEKLLSISGTKLSLENDVIPLTLSYGENKKK